jgi:hypothetical protein
MAKPAEKSAIDEIAEEAIRRIREAAQTEKKMHAIAQQPATTQPRASRAGTGAGRPPKGEAPRQRHSIGFEPKLKAWLEAQQQEGESFADTVNRLLTQKMNDQKN